MSCQKRRVRIRDSPTMAVPDDRMISDKEREQIWWSAQDLNHVRDSVKRQCRSHRLHRRYSDCLTEAYHTACLTLVLGEGAGADITDDSTSNSHSESSDAVEVQNAPPWNVAVHAMDPTTLASDDGLRPLVSDEGPRGLESYASRLHAMRRQRHLQATKHAVFLEQARQNITNERDDELLARQCANASQRARSFAAFLGQMDEHVARHLATVCATPVAIQASAAEDVYDKSPPRKVSEPV